MFSCCLTLTRSHRDENILFLSVVNIFLSNKISRKLIQVGQQKLSPVFYIKMSSIDTTTETDLASSSDDVEIIVKNKLIY